jgi:dienelactone hydrolase
LIAAVFFCRMTSGQETAVSSQAIFRIQSIELNGNLNAAQGLDIDDDGDNDLIWLKDLPIEKRSAAADSWAGKPEIHLSYPNHLDLSYFVDETGQRRPIQSADDHRIRRQHALLQLQEVMGAVPDDSSPVPLDVQINSVEAAQGYWRIHLSYAADQWQGQVDRVPAYLLLPFNLSQPVPAMLCLHQTNSQLGKKEPVGLGGSSNLQMAHQLAQRGFVCLAPDYPSFGEYEYDFQQRSAQYASGTMKGIWNHIRAVDFLESLTCVQRGSIGAIGHSLGGHNSLFVAAFDQRIKCVVTSCGFNSFQDYYQGNLAGWSSSRYMPRVKQLYHNSPDKMPFDFTHVLAAIAPRALFVSAPTRDSNFDVVGVKKCEQAVRPLYQILQADQHLTFLYPEAEHDFPAEQRELAYQWIEARLKLLR